MRRSLLLVSLLLLLPVAQGGVYATDELVAAPAAGTVLYTATDVVPSGDPVKVYLAASTGALTYTTQFDYAVTAPFSTSGVLPFTAYITCDTQTALRPGSQNGVNDLSTARAVLMKNGGEVSQASLYSLRTCDGPDDIWEAVFELASGDTAFAPGDTLNLQLLVWAPNGAPGSGAENMHVLVGGAFPTGVTGSGLPGGETVAAAPQVVHANLTGESALVEHDWATSRNDTFVYNWTAPAGNTRLNVSAAPERGNVTVTVEDAGGELFNQTLSAAGNVTALLAGGGNWTVTLAYDDYVGTLRLSAEDEPSFPSQPDDETPPDGNETGGPDGNGTSDGNDSPGPGLAALLGVLGAAVAVVRRRR